MRFRSAELVILGHWAITALLVGAWAMARPAAPQRLQGQRGLVAVLGNWAYWSTRPMLYALKTMHISPTGLTLIGLILACAAGACCAMEAWGWAGLCLLWSGISDMLDGELARAGTRASPGGALLDSVSDRLGEIAVFVGLAYSMPSRPFVVLTMAALAASLMVSYARARGEGLGVACPGGGFERPGRVVVLMLALVTAGLAGNPGGHSPLWWVQGAVAIIAIGATGTALMRVLTLYHLLGSTPPQPYTEVDEEDHASLYRDIVRPQP